MFTKSIQKAQVLKNLTKGLTTKSQANPKWDIVSAVCLERCPVITRKLGYLESRFQNKLQQVEFEKSLKSDHELRKEHDKKQAGVLKSGIDLSDLDIDSTSKQTAQDFEDTCIEEMNKFELNQTNTDDYKHNDVACLHRRLDCSLVLLVKQNLGTNHHFLLPQGVREDGETMKQAAERLLIEKCGTDLKVHFFGNAPSGFYKYKYPQVVRNDSGVVGAKVFFFIAQYLSGNVFNEKTSFKWLGQDELEKQLPGQYYDSIKQFLINEDQPE